MTRPKYKFVFGFILLAFSVFFLSDTLSAQKVRLRAQITPECASGTSKNKFADIYADGNIAVQGSFQCRGVFIYDISNPDRPVLASHYNPGANLQFLEAIVRGNGGGGADNAEVLKFRLNERSVQAGETVTIPFTK